jgi:hypothetical protein
VWAKLTRKHGLALVAVFLVTLLWWGYAKSETLVEVGPAQVADHLTGAFVLTLTERINDRYDFTLGYISPQEFQDFEINEQLFFGVELNIVSPWSDALRLGIGPYWFQNADRVSTSNFRVGLRVEYMIGPHWGVSARHWSNAGSSPEMTICDLHDLCWTNDWNTGQDRWVGFIFRF